MRLLLLLAAALAATHGLFSESPRYTRAANYYGPIESEAFHSRVKRSFLAAINGFRKPCEPGWTGPFCENPICHTKQTLTPFESDFDKGVDIMYLPENCQGEYYIPVDSTTQRTTIVVTTDRGSPIVNLTAEDGTSIQPDFSTISEGRSETYWATYPGGFVLTINMQGVPTKSCIVHVQARSKITFDAGFVNAPQADYPPFGESGESAVPNYFIAHPFGLESPSEVKTVTIRNLRFMGALYRSALTRRYDCGYEYYAGEFTCTAGNNYLYIVEGLDARGLPFRRTRQFSCYAPPTPSAGPVVSTTPSNVKECFNGGSLLTAGDSSFCFCPELFTGKQCENAVCMNGGIQNSFIDLNSPQSTKCDCTPGFEGPNCQNVVCNPNVGKILTNKKTLTVVIRNTKTMASHVLGIMQAIDEEVVNNQAYGHPVYEDFVLVSIANGKVNAKKYQFNQFASFGADVEKLNSTYADVTACTEKIYPALAGIFAQVANPQSPVFIFTDALADESDINDFSNLMRFNSLWRLRFHTFFLAQPGCSFSTHDRGFRYFHHIGRYTGGLVHTPANDDDLYKVFVGSMRGTTYGMNLVEAGDMFTCAMSQGKAMIVDAAASNLTVIATGHDLVLTLTDPTWHEMVVAEWYTGNNTWFWHIENPMPGEWIYQIHSKDITSPCAFRFLVQSRYDLFLGTTTKINMDERTFEPIVGVSSHLVAQINGFHNNVVDQFRLNAEILITSPDEDDNHQSLYYSNGLYRSSCGFHLYFGVADFCQYDDQIFYATVYADDPNGNPVQRMQIGYCQSRRGPDPSPSTNTCLNGGISVNGTACWCPAHFSGDFCDQIQCQNGGAPAESQEYCKCPYNVAGRFCELMECSNHNKIDAEEADPDFRTLAIIISTKFSMKETVKNLADRVKEFARNVVHNSPNWIESYIIVTVNQTDAQLTRISGATNFADRINYINDNWNSYSDANNKDCNVRITAGLALALDSSFSNSHTFIFADSHSTINDTDWTDSDLNWADDIHNTVTLFGPDSNRICGGTDSFGQTETDIVKYTGGKTLYLSNTDVVFTYINTFYSNGIVYESSSDSSCQIDTYIPVESLAHSLIITIEQTPGAAYISLKVDPPNMDNLKMDNLVSSDRVMISQFMAACDLGWDTTGEYCYQYISQKIKYIAALVACGNAKGGSSPVHIASDTENTFIYNEIKDLSEGAWLGLFKDAATGNWSWLSYDSKTPIPLDPAFARNYWGAGQEALLNDPTYVNAYMSQKDGKWYLATLQDTHFAICQKHRYGGKFDPEKREPDLPAGLWHVMYSSDKPCSMQIRMQSDIQVYYGFTTDVHNDYVNGALNADSNKNYVVAHAIGLDAFLVSETPEARVDYAIVGAGNTDVYPLAMTERVGCTFDAITKVPIKCPSTTPSQDIYVKFEGIDQFGYPFMRFGRTRCDRKILRCFNGGIFNNGECICGPNYAGRDCRTVLCQNGGTALADGSCKCSQLFSGPYCEYPVCDPPSPATFPTDGRTLTVMFDLSFEMKAPLFYFSGNKTADAFLRLTSVRPNWFGNFNFVPFGSKSNEAWWKTNRTMSNNYKDILEAAKHVDVCINNCDDKNCPLPIASVLMDVLNDPKVVAPDSVVVIITHSAIEDYDLSYQILPLLIAKRVHLHFVLTSASPCSLGWGNAMNKAMQTFASFSVGSINNIPSKQIPNFFGSFLPDLYKASDVVMDSAITGNCIGREHVFQIDHSTDAFTIEFFGAAAGNMTLLGPNGAVTVPPSLIAGSTTYIGQFPVNQTSLRAPLTPGAYSVRTTNDGAACNVRVRATTNITITPGFVQVHDSVNGQSQDDAHFTAIRGFPNTAVFHAEGLDYGKLEYVQLVTPKGRIITTREIKRRDDKCTYGYVMDGTFDCDFTEFELVVYGVDNKNSPFHRNFKASCDDKRPTPDPPEPSCDLDTTNTDITFLLDSSKSNVTMGQYQLFVLHMMDKFSLGASRTQVAAYTISDSAGKGGFFNFNKGNNQATFPDTIKALYSDGTTGQNIANATSSLMRDVFTSSAGYRKYTAKHLLIYLTSSEPTDVDPTNALLSLVNSKTTGVAMVTYEVAKPSAKLLGLVEPRCRYLGNQYNFVKFGTRFVEDIICRRRPICGV